MSSLTISALTLICVFGGAMLGLWLGKRLPESHRSDSSRDMVKVITGLMATLAALILGLLIASAKSSYDRANDEFRDLAAKAVLLDRALSEYGPETKEVRAQLLKVYRDRIDSLFPPSTSTHRPFLESRPLPIEDVESKLRSLLPPNDAKRAHLERALALVDAMTRAGWVLTIEQSDTGLPAPMLVVLIVWLSLMFVGFGMLSPRNTTVGVTLLVGALSVSASVFLIEEMSHPLDGVIKISAVPMRSAVEYLGR